MKTALMLSLALIGCGGGGASDAPPADAEATEKGKAGDGKAKADKGKSHGRADVGKSKASLKIPAPPNVAAAPDDAVETASGLASLVIEKAKGGKAKAGEAKGAHPGPKDSVTVHYTGWTTDGEMFDSSKKRGKPATFPLNRVIAGWTEGLQLMAVGEKRRLWIPEALAYKGMPGKPAGMLVFDVELLDIVRK